MFKRTKDIFGALPFRLNLTYITSWFTEFVQEVEVNILKMHLNVILGRLVGSPEAKQRRVCRLCP
jgi:hypothetical protein